ncbi:MAG: 4-hydroxy-tetrahydrodipicolinate reductase [Steroidobacteraceae bacterium]
MNVVIIGAAGRMGQALVRAACEFPEVRITGAVASTGSASLGRDAGELAGSGRLDVAMTDDLAAALAHADVVIDFSQPHATRSNLAVCRAARKPLLIGTTGFATELTPLFDAAATEIPLLVAANTSVGVTLLIELTRMAAQALPVEFDIEIVEAHHRLKKDAPSGTALALGRAAAAGRGLAESEVVKAAAASTSRNGERRRGDIGFAVMRGGDIVGDHTVLFAGGGEQVTLGHRASDRAIFARGALQAALWLDSRAPGRYFMRDFLGLKTVT